MSVVRSEFFPELEVAGVKFANGEAVVTDEGKLADLRRYSFLGVAVRETVTVTHENAPVEYSRLRKAELQSLLEERGLESDGKVDELRQRLEADDATE